MNESPPTFAEILTAAIQARGLSLERIRTHLDKAGVPVSIATLSYWQSGRSLPTRSRSFHTLVELERILNLDPGHLTQHTYTADGRTRREVFEWQKVMPARDLVAQVIGDLGIDMQGELTRVAHQDHLTVTADRSESHHEMRVIWRAERSGVPRWAVVSEQDAQVPTDQAIEALMGCEVGEIVDYPERHLLIAEMKANRCMQRGDLFASDYRVTTTPTAMPSFRLLRAVSNALKTLTMVIHFHPDALPSRVLAGVQDSMDDDDAPTTTVSVPLSGTQAQHVWTDAKPGVYSMVWEWD
ncbi:MAG: helix-turn-helix transcriptional regulator [Propioniciclava sp.]|uniref:helix-turn-helix domain-containing protein n=1 Tax=Propioniciclava sp. TaxID=2038686 RepID=UPI0039E69810